MTNFRLHFLQHVPFEGPGFLATWARRQGLTITFTRLYADDPLPAPTDVDAVVVLGGPMSVHDDHLYPWLPAEKEFLRALIEQQTLVLGICLGAQLLAQVLGARVYPNAEREIGWFPVRLTPEAQALPWLEVVPTEFTVLHWHGDTFEAVPGAVPLASSAACLNQGFVYQDRVIGLQFHPEMTSTGLLSLTHHCGEDLVRGSYVQSANDMLRWDYFTPNHQLLTKLLDRALSRLHRTAQ